MGAEFVAFRLGSLALNSLDSPLDSVRARIWSRTAPVALLLAVAAVLAASTLDLPTARRVRAEFGPATGPSGAPAPPEWRKLFDFAELFGHRYGLLLVAATVGALDRAGRRGLVRLIGGAYAGGFVCDALKLGLARARPFQADLEGTVGATFVAWWPLTADYFQTTAYSRAFQSFPSGHAGAAAALAWALSARYPQGRVWFAVVAVLAAAQRVLAQQHFCSDVLAGAAVGSLVALVVHSPRLGGRLFDRWEAASGR